MEEYTAGTVAVNGLGYWSERKGGHGIGEVTAGG